MNILERIAQSLTDEALVNRLRLAVDDPNGFTRAERDALMVEAADRLEQRLRRSR